MDSCKLSQHLRIRIEKSRLDIFSGELVVRVPPIAQAVADKSLFRDLCSQMPQVPHSGVIIVPDDLRITVEPIMPVGAQDTGAPPGNDIVETAHARHRQHVGDITGTLRRHQAVSRIDSVTFEVKEKVLCRMLLHTHIQQKLFPKFPPVFHIHDRRGHQMIGLLPGEALDRGTIGMDAEHIGFHRFLYHIVNLVITRIVAGKRAVCPAGAGDGIRVKLPDLNFPMLSRS